MTTSRTSRTFLDLADAVVRGERGWREELVHALARAVGADTVGYCDDLQRGMVGRSANVGGPPLSEDERRMWTHHHDEYPFFGVLLRGGEGPAERATDRLDRREFRRSVVHAEHFRPRGSRFQANFGLVHDGTVAMVGLYRATHDFEPAEVELLERGRVLLVQALRYRTAADELAALAGPTGGAPAAALPPGGRPTLTPRQREVLAMVASGATDRHVARRLRISERTVRKHLADIRDRLAVSGRTAAAAWWWTHQGPQAPTPGRTTVPERS